MRFLGANSKSFRVKIVIFLLVICVLSVIIYFDRRDRWTENFLDWVERNPLQGAISYILVYTAVTILFIPGLIFAVGCGYVYSQCYDVVIGVLLGSAIVTIGATLGSVAAFLIGRYLFESLVKTWVEKSEKFRAIQTITQLKGLRLMFLLRLSPIIPFNILNYALGLTTVTLRDYTIACLGMVPGSIAFVFLGSTLTTISEASSAGISSNLEILVFTIVGTLLAFIGLVWVSATARREIKIITISNNILGMEMSEPVDYKSVSENRSESL